jgi:hypothetical protein
MENKKGYRFYYDKSLEYLIKEELSYSDEPWATINTKQRRRNYANLFCKDMRKVLIHEDVSCAKCERTGSSMHIDHIIPVSKGGTNTVDNVQVLCYQCNLKKGSKRQLTKDTESQPFLICGWKNGVLVYSRTFTEEQFTEINFVSDYGSEMFDECIFGRAEFMGIDPWKPSEPEF